MDVSEFSRRSLALLLLAACGDDRTEPTPADVAQDVELDAAEEISSDVLEFPELDWSPETCGGRVCPARTVCVDELCLDACINDGTCDDGNECTRDYCDRGGCRHDDRAATLPDFQPGDCRRPMCAQGEVVDGPDPLDLPPDDGVFCTEDLCASGVAEHRPRNWMCTDNIAENGVETCDASRGCVSAEGQTCLPAPPLPSEAEQCDGVDNNRNGSVDEVCDCEFGAVQDCYGGEAAQRNVGLCRDGYQICRNRNSPAWSDCTFWTGPSPEICDGRDNDCNGCLDDVESRTSCDGSLRCPQQQDALVDVAHPLSVDGIFTGEDRQWYWQLTPPSHGPSTMPVAPNDRDTAAVFSVTGPWTVGLTLRDRDAETYACDWRLNARAPGLRVEVSWDTPGRAEVDLHVQKADFAGDWCGSTDCFGAQCDAFDGTVDWNFDTSPCGDGEVCRNPRAPLVTDAQGPTESVAVDAPQIGDVYSIMVHKVSGTVVTNPVVRISCGGELHSVLGVEPDGARLVAAGPNCSGSTWRVANVTFVRDEASGRTVCNVSPLTGPDGGWDIRRDDLSFD